MKFLIDKQEKYCIITLEEEKLTSLIAPNLKSELVTLSNEGFQNIILDLEHIKYIDSSGLSALLIGNRISKDNGGSFVLSRVGDYVLKLIKISKLDAILNIYNTNEEAIDAIFLHELENEISNSISE